MRACVHFKVPLPSGRRNFGRDFSQARDVGVDAGVEFLLGPQSKQAALLDVAEDFERDRSLVGRVEGLEEAVKVVLVPSQLLHAFVEPSCPLQVFLDRQHGHQCRVSRLPYLDLRTVSSPLVAQNCAASPRGGALGFYGVYDGALLVTVQRFWDPRLYE